MFKLICVTNRALCGDDFLAQLEMIAKAGVDRAILREKDLSEGEYFDLAKQALEICGRYGVECTLHSFVDVGLRLGAKSIHLPLGVLKATAAEKIKRFESVGVSTHSVEDIRLAEELGASYVTAGHIFETDCKKGLAGRGIDFLKNCCEATSLPVYAIGGIGAENIGSIRRAGAAGACIMSGFMRCEDPEEYIKRLRGEAE